jgi:hypothetical protein
MKFTGESLKMVDKDSECDHVWQEGPGELDTLLVCEKCQRFKSRMEIKDGRLVVNLPSKKD